MKTGIPVKENLRLEQELRQKNQELERITEAQRRIISIIAHDVRSPLSSIVSLFQYQNRMIDPDRFNNFLNVSSAQLHGTIALLENLVEWGKIQVQPQAWRQACCH